MIENDCQTSVLFSELVSKWRSGTASGQGNGVSVSALRGKVSFTSAFHQKKKTHHKKSPRKSQKKTDIHGSSIHGPFIHHPFIQHLWSSYSQHSCDFFVGIRHWSQALLIQDEDLLIRWHLGILASLGWNFQTKRNTGSLLAGVFLFKWQCLVNSGIDFFPWSQDEMRVWKMAGHQAFSTTLPHLGSPKGSHQMCFSTILTLGQLQVAARKSQEVLLAGRGFLGSGVRLQHRFFPRNFWWNRGGILVGNRWKTWHFLKKMGATTICQQTPRSYRFWAHFWGIENSKPQNGHFLVEIGDFKTSISFTFWRSDRIYLPRDMASSWLVG